MLEAQPGVQRPVVGAQEEPRWHSTPPQGSLSHKKVLVLQELRGGQSELWRHSLQEPPTHTPPPQSASLMQEPICASTQVLVFTSQL